MLKAVLLGYITNCLFQIVEKMGYLGIFFVTVLESFFTPIPSEFLLPFTGYLASQGKMNLFISSVFASFGSYFGTLPFYLVSYYGGETFSKKLVDKYGKFILISEGDLEKMNKLFKKKGRFTVFFGRLIPGIRSLISFPAGIFRMKFFEYTLLTILGSLTWNLLLGLAGFLMGENWKIIANLVKSFENFVLFSIAVAVSFYLYKVFKSFRKAFKKTK